MMSSDIGLIRYLAALEALQALTVKSTAVDAFSTPPQLDGELITLTLLPRARWQTLLNLEVIQASGRTSPHHHCLVESLN